MIKFQLKIPTTCQIKSKFLFLNLFRIHIFDFFFLSFSLIIFLYISPVSLKWYIQQIHSPCHISKSCSHFFWKLIENEIQSTDYDFRILAQFIEYNTHFFECPIKGSEFVNKKNNFANSYIFQYFWPPSLYFPYSRCRATTNIRRAKRRRMEEETRLCRMGRRWEQLWKRRIGGFFLGNKFRFILEGHSERLRATQRNEWVFWIHYRPLNFVFYEFSEKVRTRFWVEAFVGIFFSRFFFFFEIWKWEASKWTKLLSYIALN